VPSAWNGEWVAATSSWSSFNGGTRVRDSGLGIRDSDQV
jgi:hypothetical protein